MKLLNNKVLSVLGPRRLFRKTVTSFRNRDFSSIEREHGGYEAASESGAEKLSCTRDRAQPDEIENATFQGKENFKPSKALVLTKLTRYEFERRRYSALSEPQLKKKVH